MNTLVFCLKTDEVQRSAIKISSSPLILKRGQPYLAGSEVCGIEFKGVTELSSPNGPTMSEKIKRFIKIH